MNLLVTGGCGFIGSNFIKYILKNDFVDQLINVDSLTYAGNTINLISESDNKKYYFEKADIRDKDKLKGIFKKYSINHVVHFAAESHVDNSINGPVDFITTNIIGTFNLLEVARSNWADNYNNKFLHVSTDEVYGSLGSNGLFTEDSNYAPNSPYSASKASSDMLVRSYNKTYQFNSVITNCSNNYGPFQFPEKLIPLVIQRIINNENIPIYGDGLNIRDWLYVEDHVEALWKVLQKGNLGDTYNIGGQNEWKNIDIVNLICELYDELTKNVNACSKSLIEFVKDRPGHDRRYAIDSTKIKNQLGWQPKYTFKKGITKTLKWYLDNQEWVEKVIK